MSTCRAIDLGRLDYDDAFALQKREVERLQKNEGDDVLLFVEHPHVITVGRNADGSALIADRRLVEARGARVVATDRGGDVTYHGPASWWVIPSSASKPRAATSAATSTISNPC